MPSTLKRYKFLLSNFYISQWAMLPHLWSKISFTFIGQGRGKLKNILLFNNNNILILIIKGAKGELYRGVWVWFIFAWKSSVSNHFLADGCILSEKVHVQQTVLNNAKLQHQKIKTIEIRTCKSLMICYIP